MYRYIRPTIPFFSSATSQHTVIFLSATFGVCLVCYSLSYPYEEASLSCLCVFVVKGSRAQ
ncbi:hypothetical protein BDZ91DRAFT_724552 [Kalaharituber pfeilii]|nr:hypothetical protein BDZ91DRAFT_724552 [Kalaharituber pfeilii]